MSEMVKCPDCGAPGEMRPYLATRTRQDGAPVHSYGMALCHTCGGTAELTSQTLTEITLGSRLRSLRVGLFRSLREQAQMLGIQPEMLSQIEFGRITDENREIAQMLWGQLEETE
jgi:hypothetical protein